jgi:PKD repeat protein
MKKSRHISHKVAGTALFAAGLCLAVGVFAAGKTTKNLEKIGSASPAKLVMPDAPTPASATLTPTSGTITYTDTLVENATGVVGSPICPAANTCSDFKLTINAHSVATTKQIMIQGTWTPTQNDFDIYIEGDSGGTADGTVIVQNSSTANPSTIIMPIPADGTVYHIFILASTGAGTLQTTIQLIDIPTGANQGAGPPPRYINYPAPGGFTNGANEPSLGVDWNPNVAALRHEKVNTGGVAFFTFGSQDFRANFDDCSSPAVNLWENKSSTFTVTAPFSDPIGFVDHYSTQELGLSYPPPHTPGRVFSIDLIGFQGNSAGGYSDNDGESYLAGGNGGPSGPDHETLGGGPFHAPLITPPAPAYPNAIYYASQSLAEAEVSRSDDGGQTFGPFVPLFNPTVCLGGIHGHVKVSPQGTAYIPNSSCFTGNPGGVDGVATSTDNGITWTQRTIPNSTGSQDPSVGIGQNNVGKPGGQVPNTIYLGYVSSDNHAHIAHSPDEGVTWQDDIDVGSILGVQNAAFPVVVAGDDNRAAYAFVGTTVGGVGAYAGSSFPGVWHLYIAHTYDGGHSWILIDATPDDPVQKGVICLLGLSCSSSNRNLLDFNDFAIDAEGRGLVGYTDGCLNCNNTYTGQSSQGRGTIARQSGGRRLFSAFDPVEPAVPAAPNVLSSVRQAGPPPGVLISWVEPDNSGSPITGYKVYRSNTNGAETFLASVSGNTTTKYIDQTADTNSNWFYRVTAVNAIGEGTFCREVNVNGVQPVENACVYPYLTMQTDPIGDQTGGPTVNMQEDITRVGIGEPFNSCGDKSITFFMKVQNLSPAVPPGAAWMINFKTLDATNTLRTVYVQMDTQTSGTPAFNYGFIDPTTGQKVNQCGKVNGPATCPVTGSNLIDGSIVIKLDRSAALKFFGASNVGSIPDFTLNLAVGSALTNITGQTQLGLLQSVDTTNTGIGAYTLVGNLGCLESLPSAGLTATPTSGQAPLSVNFDASTSTKSQCAASITSYTLDFGDGTSPVTQASPLFAHTYNSPGDYPAGLTVTDSAGLTSPSAAQISIHVTSGQIQLGGVVSRMTHGSAGDFDVILPLTGTRAVECRSSTPGNYKLVFAFVNNLVSVSSAGINSGIGTVSSSAIGPNPNQYTVNLTGVSDQQYISVALVNAKDSTGATGNVISPQMGILVGDVNASGRVDAADVSSVRQQTLQAITTSNFRDDLNASGRIDAADVSVARQNTLHSIPTP